MPTPDAAPVGAPCWIDLTSSDTRRARSFYGQLFGWAAEEPAPEFGGYFTSRKDDIRVAGCMASQPGSGRPDTWSVYLASDDATHTLDAAVASGGQVVVPAMDVGDLGTMAVAADPGGAGIGIWQPASFQGFGSPAGFGAVPRRHPRPEGRQLGHADRRRCAPAVPERRTCDPTAQQLLPGMLVLLDRPFERNRVLRRDQPCVVNMLARARVAATRWSLPICRMVPHMSCVDGISARIIQADVTATGASQAGNLNISRCTGGTTVGPDLVFSKINVPSELVVRAGSRRRPSASGIDHRRLNAAAPVVLPARFPSLASGGARRSPSGVIAGQMWSGAGSNCRPSAFQADAHTN
jgi:predicted enzyme related to lactoylglutathione lyase